MDEDKTFIELAIGNLLKRKDELKQEWEEALDAAHRALDIGDFANMSPKRTGEILAEMHDIDNKIVEFYINQQKND